MRICCSLGTEFGLNFTVDGGRHWVKAEGRNAGHNDSRPGDSERVSDLVAASFGRGFFVLDDYGRCEG